MTDQTIPDTRRVVFLLGAGASKEAGLPLADGLVECLEQSFVDDHRAAKDQAARALIDAERTLFELVLTCMGNAANPAHDPGNFEAVAETIRQLGQFSVGDLAPFVQSWQPELLELVGNVSDRRTLAQQWRELPLNPATYAAAAHRAFGRSEGLAFERLWHRINWGLRQWLWRDFQSSQIHYLAKLAQLIGPRDVFTLNFDLAMEYACLQAGIEFTTGFSEQTFEDPFSGKSRTRGEWTPGVLEKSRSALRLQKLHGSIAWHVTRPIKRTEVVEYGRDQWPHMAELEEEKLGEYVAFMHPGEPSPMMFGNGTKLPRHEPFVTLYARWLSAIRDADVLVTIGCRWQSEPIVSDAIVRETRREKGHLYLIDVTSSSNEASDLQCVRGTKDAVESGALAANIREALERSDQYRNTLASLAGA